MNDAFCLILKPAIHVHMQNKPTTLCTYVPVQLLDAWDLPVNKGLIDSFM